MVEDTGGIELFVATLPTISLSDPDYGKTGQMMTLMPDRNFATHFFADEVEEYISLFEKRMPRFTGGHVKSYQLVKEPSDPGRYIIRVTQNVE